LTCPALGGLYSPLALGGNARTGVREAWLTGMATRYSIGEWIPSLLLGAFFAALAIADWFEWNPNGQFAKWARVVFVCAIFIFLAVENGRLKSRIGVLEKDIADLRARPPS
jgi:hypothetical protein